MKKITSALLLSSVIASPVFADNYVSASITKGKYDIEGFDKPTGFAIAMGIPMQNNSAFEFGYVNLGDSEGSFSGVDMTLSATSLYGAARFNFNVAPNADLYTKIGLNNFSAKAEVDGFSASESEIKLMYSFGAQYKVAQKIALGADYTSYEADTTAFALNLKFDL